MALQSLELGTAADDGTGDSLRVGGDKINDNFVEIYTALGDGDALSSGISASATVITLTSPIISTPIITTPTTTSASDADHVLINDGGVLKKITTSNLGIGGTAGSVAADDIGTGDAAVTIATSAGNITIDAQAGDTDIIFKGTDGSSDITALTLDMSDAGKAIFTGAISATTLTLSADGGVIVPNDGNIGSAGSTSAMQISSAGIVTFADDIIIKDGGTIGSATDVDAIAIGSDGDVTLTQDLELQHDGAILSFGANDEVTLTHVHDTGILLNSTNVIQFNDASQNIGAPTNAILDINATDEIELNATLVDINANVEISGTAAIVGIATFTDDIVIGDGKTIGSASAATAMTIASTGIVTFVDDILIKDTGTIGSASTPAAIAIAANGTITTAAGIELGHASDTTIARSAAGVVQVEGVTVGLLAPANIWVGAQRATVTALTSSSNSIAIALLTTNDYSHTFTENTTLANPSDTLVAGQSGSIFLTQHASSPKTLAFGSEYDFVGGTVPTVTAANSARDRLDYVVRADAKIEITAVLNLS